jgi:hypothetical protein
VSGTGGSMKRLLTGGLLVRVQPGESAKALKTGLLAFKDNKATVVADHGVWLS